jgi:hypothetical protein
MKVLTIAGIPTLLVLCVGMVAGQDAAHDVDKAVTKTGHVVRHATTKVGRATKRGTEDVGHGTKVAAKDIGKGVKTSRLVRKRPAMALRIRLPSSRRIDC